MTIIVVVLCYLSSDITYHCFQNNVQVSPSKCVVIPGLPLIDKTGRLQLQYCKPDGCLVADNAAGRTGLSAGPESPDLSVNVQSRWYYSQWYQWGYWSKCDRTCGEGIRKRYALMTLT